MLALSNCCASPLHTGHLPPIVEAGIAIAVVVAMAFLIHLAWLYMNTPLSRHACRLCARQACGFCQREERDARVNEYARDALARKQERA